MKICFKTLGCRVNLYETDALASRFHEAGWDISTEGDADVYVVNTCTVTNMSDQKSRQFLHQIRREHGDALIIATGCMVNHRKQELIDSGIVNYVVDNEHKHAIFDIVTNHFADDITGLEDYDADLFAYSPAFNTFHTRSLVKIHDGCNNFCSYCIIPMVRGRATSRPDTDIYQNITELVSHGFKEIVLTGVNMGRYKYNNIDFEQLIKNILSIDGDFRVRISSIEPDNFSDDFIRLFDNEKLAPHMHICLQSGCDRTLFNMRRHYDTAQFREMCKKIRAAVPHFNITTDVIVGFPQESDDDFRQSADFCKELGFSHIHTFKYSKRSFTKAAVMEGQIPGTVKTERSAVIRQISAENKQKYFSQMLGRPQRMLIERIDSEGFSRGYGENYIPIRLKHKGLARNTFVDVILDGIIEKGDDSEMTGHI